MELLFIPTVNRWISMITELLVHVDLCTAHMARCTRGPDNLDIACELNRYQQHWAAFGTVCLAAPCKAWQSRFPSIQTYIHLIQTYIHLIHTCSQSIQTCIYLINIHRHFNTQMYLYNITIFTETTKLIKKWTDWVQKKDYKKDYKSQTCTD